MKKMLLGLMLAFAATAEAASSLTSTIDGIKYEFDGGNKTATIIGFDERTLSARSIYVDKLLWSADEYAVTSVGASALNRCQILESVSLPNVASVGQNAFSYSQLTSVLLPNATTIEQEAFYKCLNLKEVSLPNATTIGAGVFGGCSSLTMVLLPNVTSFGRLAFSGCSALESLIVKDRAVKSELSGNRSYYGIGSAVRIYYELTKEQAEAVAYAVKSVCPKLDGDEIYEDVYQKACETYGVAKKTAPNDPQLVQEGEIAVTKESIAAAKAMTVQIVNGQIELGVSVCSNADITASSANWAPVKFAKDTQIGLSADGTKLVLPIPVAAQQGFMILQSGDVKAVPSDGGTSGFYMIKVVQ